MILLRVACVFHGGVGIAAESMLLIGLSVLVRVRFVQIALLSEKKVSIDPFILSAACG